jgi:hypothetical protein
MEKVFTNFKEGTTQIISAAVIPDGAVPKVFYGLGLLLLVIGLSIIIIKATEKPVADDVKKLEYERQLLLNKSYSKLSGQNSLYTGLIKTLHPLEQYLVNLQPLTAVFGGYIGPTTNGVFSVEYYLQNALRMGIRSFVLPISTYTDPNKTPPYWPLSGKPAIVFRDQSGIITSRNALSIKKFCETLLVYQNENQAQSSEPILLHIVPVEGYVPDPVKEEKSYVLLMKDIADELRTINTKRLMTLGSFGNATGGENETKILTQLHLNDLKNKILIFTTFDTRLGLKDAYKNIKPNLYEFANFMPKPLVADAGTTTTQPNVLQGVSTESGSKLIRLADISGSKINWANQARTTLYQANLDSYTEAPVSSAVANALKAGIHIIPIPFFYLPFDKSMEEIYKLWGGFAWKVKEKDLRFKKPEPIVPAPAKQSMNARVDSKLQPGQTKIL